MRSERINFLAVVTAVAGLTGFIGVYAKWFSYSYPVSGGSVTIYLDGTWDGTGAIALAAGIGTLVFSCAYILLRDAVIRRIVGLLMVISSVVLLVSSIIGLTRVGEAIGPNPFLPGAEGTTPFNATVAIGLGISLLSGILATVASMLLVGRREAGIEDEAELPTAASA
jgi:multisubunit Na+/H+ antiporter MnhC subunit